MTTMLRAKRPRKEIYTPLVKPYTAHEKAAQRLRVPDPITFATSPLWCNRTLYPRQATVLKIIFLRDDLFTDYDYEVIAEWEEAWRQTGDEGTPPGLIKRIKWLQAKRREEREIYPYLDPRGWFREIIFVLGRRAGKGYVSAIAMAYVLYCYMAKFNPQARYQIDRDKRMTCLIYAGRKEQARDNLWRDLVNIISGAPCFQLYISKPLGESLSVYAPSDLEKLDALRRKGQVSALDLATFKIDPLPATPMSGRGGAGFMIAFDEMAHMIATGANRSSDEVWVAATPSLDQFGMDAFIVCPSSPWEMIGQFYKEWEQAQEIDPETDFFAYPEKFVLQLASWQIYDDWERTLDRKDFTNRVMDMFPTDSEWDGDLHEYVNRDFPKFTPLFKPVQGFDDQMRRMEKADPQNFLVERKAKWQATMDAYLDEKKIKAMFNPIDGVELAMRESGALSTFYKAHADPGFVNDPFGFAIAHTETFDDGFQHVIFDHLHRWEPHEFDDNTIDYDFMTETLWDYIVKFNIDDLSFDQHQSRSFLSTLTKRSREKGLAKRIAIHIINENAPYNLRVAETFKIALNMGWIHAPYFEIAELELRFLKFEKNKVVHQTAGPVQHDDVARSMFEVVFALLERQVTAFMMGEVALTPAMSGGAKPFMHPTNGYDKEIIGQFGAAARQGRGRGASGSPARGRPGFTSGRGPLPRMSGRR